MEKENLIEKRTQIIEKRLLILDTRKCGLKAIWSDWEAMTLDSLICSDERTSMEAFTDVQRSGIIISRGSVIGFLNRLCKAGFATYRMETARGGYRRVYSLKLRSWDELNNMVIDRLLFKLWEIFPENERIKVAVA